jgi:hypothetical protein
MQVCNENHSAVVVFDNNACPLCAMLDAFGQPQDAVELGTTPNTGSQKCLHLYREDRSRSRHVVVCVNCGDTHPLEM